MLGRLIWAGLALLFGWVILRAIREQSAPPSAAPASQPPTWTYQPPTLSEQPPHPPAPSPNLGEGEPRGSGVAEPAAPPAADGVNESAAPSATIEIYCVRCKERREVPNAAEERTANGRRAARGICPVCGAKVFTFLREQESTETSA